MAKIVLVHGAWHWGGCWAPVQALLEQAGHSVYAPSLALHRGSTLGIHIEQIVDLIREQQLDQLVLVGHSYGGVVASGVLARLPGRIHHTVLLDTVLSEPGRSLLDLVMPRGAVLVLKGLVRFQPMWPSFASAEGFGIHDVDTARWIDSHLRPHPAATFLEPFPYTVRYESARCTYVACTELIQISGQATVLNRLLKRFKPASSLAVFARRAATAGWRVIELPLGHDLMVIAPEQVAAIINAVAPTLTHQVVPA
jgi:pimeloyl-ACP methyl ester carboxylesterase